MLRYLYLFIGCMTMTVPNLSAAANTNSTDVQNYKAKIVAGVSEALSQGVKGSPNARSSASSRCERVETPCGCITLISPEDINPNGFTITRPGIYHLKRNTFFDPSGPGLAAIIIDSDNVVLDLCGHVLAQTGELDDTTGIVVDGDMNVIVENGTIEGFSLSGIFVFDESSFVTLSNLNLFDNGDFDTVGGGIIVTSSDDIVIENIDASENFFAGLVLSGVNNVDVITSKFNLNMGADTGYGINNSWGVFATAFFLGTPDSFAPISNLNVSRCEFNGNTSAGGSVGIEVLGIPSLFGSFNTNVNILNCVANNNAGGGSANVVNEGEGIVVAGTQNFVVRDCYASGNHTLATAPSGTAGFYSSTGFGVPFFGQNGVFENCIAQGNSGAGDISDGFRILRSNNITVANCVASSNNNTSTGEAWGFTTDTNIGNTAGEFGPVVNNNFLFIDCVAINNTSTNTISGGFKFISQANSTITESKSIGNSGYGFYVGNPACCTSGTPCCTLDPATCLTSGTCVTATCCPTSKNVISYNEATGNTITGFIDAADASAHNAFFGNIARGNLVSNYSIPTPPNLIRVWPMPGFPNLVPIDPQLDNISITP